MTIENDSSTQEASSLDSLVSNRFDSWWNDKGSGMAPLPGEDAETHVHRVCKIAWENGALAASEAANALTAYIAAAILIQKAKVERLRAISNAKNLYLHLMDYEADEGQFPTKLSDLVDAEIIAEDALAELTSYTLNGKVHNLVYIPSLSTEMDSNLIILHSPDPIDGKYLILRIDGELRMVSEQEFEKLIKSKKSEE